MLGRRERFLAKIAYLDSMMRSIFTSSDTLINGDTNSGDLRFSTNVMENLALPQKSLFDVVYCLVTFGVIRPLFFEDTVTNVVTSTANSVATG